ncbi:SEC-C motif-containing protein [Ruminiclostridium sufflavum DSM 19573]|uniref:SEC-C motif-containing protein n=1 Tax=Ruminiclostridium sufflavum DSM 19573 TaxID=1121337 RepID=A0A318XMW5_9FIRM|nr:SEC-C metal-binding domain-containing protein [Ruminiclostridium sufflavum]PYG87277.1 SEC-C motif-containing protein [Ruminiclostridium sufflavum DSM 19573]
MTLYEKWSEIAEKDRTPQENEAFWKEYFLKEKDNYADILANNRKTLKGTLSELAGSFNMDTVTFTGFLDGINTSLTEEVDLESLEDTTELDIEIDYEKLYFNMLDAKADWLYNLTEWNDILSEDTRKSITKEFRISKMAVSSKVGRNEPCPCGSGKKYKKCCGKE